MKKFKIFVIVNFKFSNSTYHTSGLVRLEDAAEFFNQKKAEKKNFSHKGNSYDTLEEAESILKFCLSIRLIKNTELTILSVYS